MLLCAAIGESYGKLPSEVLSNGNIFDIMALDVKNSWDEYQRLDPAERAAKKAQSLSTEALTKVMSTAKAKKNGATKTNR